MVFLIFVFVDWVSFLDSLRDSIKDLALLLSSFIVVLEWFRSIFEIFEYFLIY